MREREQVDRRACERLLALGITSVHDATPTNGPDEWQRLNSLAESGALPIRLTMLVGLDHWQKLGKSKASIATLRRGPVKVMLDERTTDLTALQMRVESAHQAGRKFAFHASSEAELVMALALSHPGDRIEHASVVPDALLLDVRAAGVAIVGHPSLVALRGDVYRDEFPREQHPWLASVWRKPGPGADPAG